VPRRTLHTEARDLYINGTWVTAAGTASCEVLNPATGEVIRAVPDGGREAARQTIDAAADTFGGMKDSCLGREDIHEYLETKVGGFSI
jgi:hypothetical protein